MLWSISSKGTGPNNGGAAEGGTIVHVVWRWVALVMLVAGGFAMYPKHHDDHDTADQRLQFMADPRAGEAYMSVVAHTASVTWEWGSAHRVLQAQVLVNTVLTNPRTVQVLRLRANGVELVLIGKAGIFFCTEGCDAFHLPLAWSFNRDG
jgi:hypothetical protein